MLEYSGWIYRYHVGYPPMRIYFPVLNSSIIVYAYFPYFYILGCFQTCTLFDLFRNRDLICYNVAFSSWFGSLSQGSIGKRTKLCLCKSHLSKTVLLLVRVYLFTFLCTSHQDALTSSFCRLNVALSVVVMTLENTYTNVPVIPTLTDKLHINCI